MAKHFPEVFPGLNLKEEYRALFDKVEVERVTATRQKDFVRIYISCDRLIEKPIIFEVEEQIKNQLFSGCNITIKIQEKFRLSGRYDPEKLLEAYRESILLELKACSPVEYSIFKNAELSFESGGRLKLEVPDTVIVRERCPELIRILEKICCERCGIPVEVFAEYAQPGKNRSMEEGEEVIARKVAEISGEASGARQERREEEPSKPQKEARGAASAAGGEVPFEGGTVRSAGAGVREGRANGPAAGRKAGGWRLPWRAG